MLKLRIGKGWSKSLHFHTGQAPVLQYNRQLMQAILHDRLPIAKIVNATVIPLDQAPKGYEDFGNGAAKKFVLDPNGLIKKAA
jgi:glutathione-independent formaldehyde dehydrogenase